MRAVPALGWRDGEGQGSGLALEEVAALDF